MILYHTQSVAEALEVHDLTLPQELERLAHIRIIDQAQQIVIRAAGFLFWGDLVSTTYTKI